MSDKENPNNNNQLGQDEPLESKSVTKVRTYNFKPGQSGNPGGRPKKSLELKQACQNFSREALATLIKVMAKGKKDSDRIQAAKIILAYGFGQPDSHLSVNTTSVATNINTNVTPEQLSRLSLEQLEQYLDIQAALQAPNLPAIVEGSIVETSSRAKTDEEGPK